MRHDEFLGFLHYLITSGDQATPTWAGHWELAFWAVAILVTLLLVLLRPLWVVRAEDGFRRISQHRTAAVWGVVAAVIVIRTMLLPLIPIPIPVVHDEFSYLLGADTFASGRLTNPPHPMWIHFETFHVNMQPSYQSMYPPAQAITLALGQKLMGEPWVGVLLSVAVMCGAFCWMLQGWMPPQWALLGGLFAVMRYGTFSYWINSYWGGAVAATGGALLLGALPRLRHKLTLLGTVIFVIGLAILANSRPFEGLLFGLPLFVAFAWLVFCSPLPRRQLLFRIVIPCLSIVVLTTASMLFYNLRSTGNPLQMPYTINHATYHISKPFIFQKPNPIPTYRHPEMRVFYLFHEYPDVLHAQSSWGVQLIMSQKFFCYYSFMVWPFLLLFVPGMLLAARSPEMRIVFLALVLLLLGLTIQLWPAHGHYAAPGAGAVLLILLNALRQLRTARDSVWFPWFTRAIVLTALLWMLVPLGDRLWNPYLTYESAKYLPEEINRQRVQSQISHLPGQHLILVHYFYRDVPSMEWVYNRADIDNSKVVWARDMGPEANQELLRYYANRQVWYVDRRTGSVVMPYATAVALTDPARVLLEAR